MAYQLLHEDERLSLGKLGDLHPIEVLEARAHHQCVRTYRLLEPGAYMHMHMRARARARVRVRVHVRVHVHVVGIWWACACGGHVHVVGMCWACGGTRLLEAEAQLDDGLHRADLGHSK